MDISRSHPRFLSFLVVLALAAGSASAAPIAGFVEDWPGTSEQSWAGGSLYSNPGTGGVGGTGDGFLRVATPTGARLGTVSFGEEYNGNWQAADIRSVRLWLRDVDGDDPLEIHLSLGNSTNFWQYDQGFLPPEDAWAEFVIDLTDGVAFTQIIGGGSFVEALENVDRVHVRHDHEPFEQIPDTLTGEFGLDRLQLVGDLVAVPPGTRAAARPIAMAPPYPNPSRGPVVVSLSARDDGPIALEVVDLAGRRIRRAELPAGVTGERLWVWDGLDDRGGPVAPGAYRVRASGRSGGTSRALVRVR